MATLLFRAAQARNTIWAKRNPESTVWVIEYLCVYPEPSVRLTLRSPPPPGSFSTVTCVMGKLKPQQISQTGIFTSPLFNPITLTALKPLCACVCDRSKSSPNSKSVQPTAQYKHPTMKSRQAANQHGAEQWWDMLLYDLSGESHKDGYWIEVESTSTAALGSHVWMANAE